MALNYSTGVAVNSAAVLIPNLQYTVTSPNTISSATVTVPSANGAKGTLYAYNAGNGANGVITANNTAINYSFTTYPNLAFQPANGFVGPYTFTYTVTDNTGAVSNSATYTIYVGAPTAKPQTSQVLLSSFGAVTLSLPLVGTPDPATTNTVNGFIIRTLPAGSAGVLALNGTPVAVNQVIATTDAANLTFDPAAGYFGTAVFTYSARDNAGNIGAAAGYGIPVSNGLCSAGAATTQRSVLDFTSRTIGENFAATNSITVDGVTVTASPAAYPFTAGSNTQSSFDVQDLTGLPGKGIAWQENYNTGSSKSSSVTFTFSKPVANFTMTMGDIDRNTTTNADQEYIDRVVFNGYDASGNLITLSSANVSTGVGNTFSGGNAVTATAGSDSDPANNVTVTFPQSITRLTLTYSNQTANADAGFQFTSIPQFEWCNSAAAAAVATTINGPSTAVVGQTVQYTATTINNGGQTATNDVVTITLPNKPAAGTVTVTNGTYDPSTGIVTFAPQDIASGATVTNVVRFVAQASPTTVTGTAASTTSAFDADASDNNGSMANATVSTVVSPTGAAGTPAPCATAGKDGAVTLSTNPNAYYPSIAAQTRAAGSTTIQVGPARGAATNIAPGDLLLVIQMQGADIDASNTNTYGSGQPGTPVNGNSVTTNFTAGTYEYVAVAAGSATVTAGSGGTITLATALKNSYVNAVATATTGQRTFQVVRIPQYSTLTLAANIVPAAWDGSTGGIVAIGVAGQLNMAGYSIDASGKGFRGGAGRQLGGDNTTTTNTDYRSSAALNTHATKGEGIVGTPRYVNDNNALLDTRTSPLALPAGLNDGYPNGDNGRGAPGNAGGGGTDANHFNNDQNTGGGGGANGGQGGRG
ncbi:beta strand repeat-containing protein, partial [Hymenobacter agri]